MNDFPTTLPEFQERFGDDEACLRFLHSMKWPNGFRCPKCHHDRSYAIDDRRVEECAKCGHQASVTAGTMFHRIRKPLSTWFRAIFEFVSRKDGCNAMDLMRLFDLSYPTAWSWLHKIRDTFVRPNRESLAGVVEADESYVGAPEPGAFGRDRGENKILVAGAVEVVGEGCGRARLAPVGSASAEDLQTFVAANVEEGATVRTDGLVSYDGLKALFKHKVTVIGDPKTASKKFPRIHRVFSLFKRTMLGTYHGSWSDKFAAMYCEEFTFRFNRRGSSSRTHLFRRIIEYAVLRKPRLHLVAGSRFPGRVAPEAA